MSTNTNELACVYASLILHDDNIKISDEKLNNLISAAGLDVPSIWTSVFARALQGKNLNDLLFSFSSAPAPAAAAAAPEAAAAPAGGAPAAGKKAEKKEEPKPESDEEMGFGLFD